MFAVYAVVATAPTGSGLLLAVTVAAAVTALAALGMVVLKLRRTMRLTGVTTVVSVASALAILIGAVLVGGSLTQPPTSIAERTGSKVAAQMEKLPGLQLPTLGYED